MWEFESSRISDRKKSRCLVITNKEDKDIMEECLLEIKKFERYKNKKMPVLPIVEII